MAGTVLQQRPRAEQAGLTWLAGLKAPQRSSFQRMRIALADDHTLMRQGIRAMLELVGDFDIVAEASDGRQAVLVAENERPDLMIIDVTMPLLNGLEATRQIRQRAPGVKVLAMLPEAKNDLLFDLLQAGANGCILKGADVSELIRAIGEIERGNTYLAPAISQTMVWDYLHLAQTGQRRTAEDPLSPREREVLQLIAEGYGNQQIAGQLFLSVKTVEAHKAHIMEKLGIKGKTELLKYALKKGMINLDD